MTPSPPASAPSWLVRYGDAAGSANPRLTLLCFHYAGATASIFRSWSAALPAGVELIAIQLPGREYRLAEPPVTDMREIVRAVQAELAPLLGKPYVVFGHSLGVLIGFDVIRAIRQAGGREPELLVASGRNAPSIRWRDAGLQLLPDEEFVEAVRSYSGTPDALLRHASLRDLWVPRLRADLTLSAEYDYTEQAPLCCPIYVMFGADDDLVTESGLQSWLSQTNGAVRYLRCPGNHFFLHSAEQFVLSHLRAELLELMGSEGYMENGSGNNVSSGREGRAQNGHSAATDRVRVLDTTLRDGEQSSGVMLNPDEKLEIAQQLARLGVDVIEAGFPAASPGELSGVQRIANTVGRSPRTAGNGEPVEAPMIAAMARASRRDIDAAWEAIKGAIHPCIHIVLPTSDIHLEHKLRKTRREVLVMAEQAVSYARSLCPEVEFSPEDATRSDPEFLVQVLDVAVAAGATTLNIPDTVGYALPHEFGAMIRALKQRFPSVVLSVHGHNDLGLGTANTLAGIENGCRQIEVTINGIGERAGNACLAETVMILHTRRAELRIETNIVRTEIGPTSKLVSALTGIPVQPNKAVVGANAFSHVGGIHQDGVLKNRRTYEIMDAADVGFSGESRIVLGKHSGRNALRAKLENLGYRVAGEQLDFVFRRFKDAIDLEKAVSDAQLRGFCEDLAMAPAS